MRTASTVAVAVDDASRLAYTEVLADAKKATACAFMTRALAWYGRNGVAVERVMSDNVLYREGNRLIGQQVSVHKIAPVA